MGLPLWAWIIFYVLVLLMLVADLIWHRAQVSARGAFLGHLWRARSAQRLYFCRCGDG
jgi:hypothetical protein